MNQIDLYQRLKTMAVRLEEHSWSNRRGSHFQSAIILKPALRKSLTDLLREFDYELSPEKLSKFKVAIGDKEHSLSIHGHEELTNVNLRLKKSYKSYMANLDEPAPAMLKLRKKRLDQSRSGIISQSNLALLELQFKEEMKRPFRDYILQRISQNGDKDAAKVFIEKLRTSQRCLITNFVTAQEVLWASLRRVGQKTEDLRLPEGVNVFLSQEDRSRPSGKVSALVAKAENRGWLYGDWVIV